MTGRPAGLGARVAAQLIHVGVLVGLCLPPLYWFAFVAPIDWSVEALMLWLLFLLAGGITWVGLNVRQMDKTGRSVGKSACGLSVVVADQEIPELSRLVLRRCLVPWVLAAAAVVATGLLTGSAWCGGVALLALGLLDLLPALGGSRRCVHDRLAGTRVVRSGGERVVTTRPAVQALGFGALSTGVVVLAGLWKPPELRLWLALVALVAPVAPLAWIAVAARPRSPFGRVIGGAAAGLATMALWLFVFAPLRVLPGDEAWTIGAHLVAFGAFVRGSFSGWGVMLLGLYSAAAFSIGVGWAALLLMRASPADATGG